MAGAKPSEPLAGTVIMRVDDSEEGKRACDQLQTLFPSVTREAIELILSVVGSAVVAVEVLAELKGSNDNVKLARQLVSSFASNTDKGGHGGRPLGSRYAIAKGEQCQPTVSTPRSLFNFKNALSAQVYLRYAFPGRYAWPCPQPYFEAPSGTKCPDGECGDESMAKAHSAVAEYFDAAFERARDRPAAPSTGATSDVIERTRDAGLRIAYSETTATWLADVASAGHDADLTPLAALCATRDHPLGALVRGFALLFEDLHGRCRWHRRSEPTGNGTERPPARAVLALAASAATFQCGAAKLLALVLDVLPPLRMVGGAAVAEIVDASLFSAVAQTLHPLTHAAARHDKPFASAIDTLATLEPTELAERLGVPEPWRAEPSQPLRSAIEAARAMRACEAPRAKLRRFLAACELVAADAPPGTLGADGLICTCAFVLVAARLHEAPAMLRLISLFVTQQQELIGPLGYALATFEGAICLLEMEGCATITSLA